MRVDWRVWAFIGGLILLVLISNWSIPSVESTLGNGYTSITTESETPVYDLQSYEEPPQISSPELPPMEFNDIIDTGMQHTYSDNDDGVELL